MRINRIAIAALAGTLLASCAADARVTQTQQARAQRELAQALEGRTPGKPVDCIPTDFSNGPQVIDEHTLIYRGVGRTIYRAEVIGACPSLDNDAIIISEVWGSQICRNDRFRVLQRGTTIPSPSCRMGRFTPYTKAK